MEDDFRTEELLFMIKKINLNLSSQLELSLKSKDITGVQVYFLVYILRHHPKGTYLTELCREIGVSKATLSALIKKMREKDYLYFHSDSGDVRKKKVLPTARLKKEGKEFLQKAGRMETEICSALDPGERKTLWILERKLAGQMARMEASQSDEKEKEINENKESRQEVYQP